jgi:hypothetical protein
MVRAVQFVFADLSVVGRRHHSMHRGIVGPKIELSALDHTWLQPWLRRRDQRRERLSSTGCVDVDSAATESIAPQLCMDWWQRCYASGASGPWCDSLGHLAGSALGKVGGP